MGFSGLGQQRASAAGTDWISVLVLKEKALGFLSENFVGIESEGIDCAFWGLCCDGGGVVLGSGCGGKGVLESFWE